MRKGEKAEETNVSSNILICFVFAFSSSYNNVVFFAYKCMQTFPRRLDSDYVKLFINPFIADVAKRLPPGIRLWRHH